MVNFYFIKGSLNNSTLENSTNLTNTTNSTLDHKYEEGSNTIKERLLKFFISTKTECSVYINETIIYSGQVLTNPIEHVVLVNNTSNKLKIIPISVTSKNVTIDYFGFSKGIKTFSAYYNNTNNLTTFDIEYNYIASKLIKSFSDFRNEASYENITYNYNQFSWKIKNENINKETQNLKIEIYFDLGANFVNEYSNFTLPMEKSIISKVGSDNSYQPVVKFTSNTELNYNNTLIFDAKFPLYFENCKNYKLNLIVLLTGFVFIGFFVFVVYMTIYVIFTEEMKL